MTKLDFYHLLFLCNSTFLAIYKRYRFSNNGMDFSNNNISTYFILSTL